MIFSSHLFKCPWRPLGALVCTIKSFVYENKYEKYNFLGATSLIVAAQKGNLEVVKLLLQREANVNANYNYGMF